MVGLEAGQRGVAGLEPEPEPEQEPGLPVDMLPPPAMDAFRPRSMGGDEVGVRDVGKDWLIQAGFDPPPPPVYGRTL